MRLRSTQVKSLQALLKKLYGLDCTDEQTQVAGLQIMRFVAAKAQREKEIAQNERLIDGQTTRANRNITQ